MGAALRPVPWQAPSARHECPEVEALLTHLVVQRNLAASTQNQAKSTLLYLYKSMLSIEHRLAVTGRVIQAKVPRRLSVVPTPCEVRELLQQMQEPMWLTQSNERNLARPR